MTDYRLPAQVTVKAYGRGAGKTYAATRWALARALNKPNTSVGFVGPVNDRDAFIRQFSEAAAEAGVSFEHSRAHGKIFLENDSTIALHDCDKPDRLRGPSYKYIVGEDVGKWPEETYQNVKFACRSNDRDRAGMFFTFVGTESERILDALGSGFEGTTN